MRRKILLSILSLACAGLTACGFIGGDSANSGATGEQTQMEQIYAQYLVYAQAEGIQPLSYEAWLATVKGEDGKSAYEIWLENGHSGSQADFLEWLKGEKGEDGAQGIQGEQGVQGEKGEQGIQGEKGDQGEQGTQGDKGDKGDQGEQGIQGEKGEDGRGIASIQLVGCQLIITYTDGTVDTFDMPVGGGGSSVPSHNYGDWICFSGEDLSCEQRIFYRICEGCNDIEWKKGSAEDHKWAAEYSYDKNYHWYACENCDETKDYAEHTLDEDAGECSLCYAPMSSTAGIVYELSADRTYAEVIGYEGTAKRVRIADTYEGVPVKTIYERAFYQNSNITSVIIPDSITSIGDDAFCGCTSLTSVVIPDSVTSIGDGAFWYCIGLTSVVIPDSVTSIGDGAFSGCESLTYITVDENNEKYKDIDGNLYSKDGTILIQYAIGKTASSFTIPDSVTSIGEYAFSRCSSLTSVVIGESVTSIGEDAFSYCSSLTSVVIGDSVTSIGNYAFSQCSSLTSVEIPDSVTSIGEFAFYDCDSLTSVEIPDSVTSIGNYAFSACSSLTSVVIPDSVTSIGEGAFSGYSLTSVYYKGSASEWSELEVDDWEINYATLYYYSESQPTTTGNYWHYDENGEIAVW